MKRLIFTFFSFCCVFMNSFANADADFEQFKADAIQRLDRRSSNLEETKNCIAQASDREAVQLCYRELRSKQSSLRDEFKQKKKDRRQSWKKEQKKNSD